MKLLILAALGCLPLSPMSAAGSLPRPTRGGELKMAIRSEPKSLDPHLATEENADLVAYLTHGVLVRINRQSQAAQGEVASSWKLRPDGKSISFALRPGLRFSDGARLLPGDVCFSIQRILDPALDSPSGEALRGAAGKVKCMPSPVGVSLSFERALSSPERWWDGIAIVRQNALRLEQVGLGPFAVREWKSGSHILLERNEHYWKKDADGQSLPYLSSIRLVLQRNRDIEMLKFSRQEFDMIQGLDAELYTKLQERHPAAGRAIGPSLDTEQLWFNQVPSSPIPAYKKAWFTSTAFRTAISAAINREDLARVVYKGQATPAVGPISPVNRMWSNPALRASKADAKLSLRQLEAEGFQLNGDTLYDRDRHAVEITVITNSGNKNREKILSLMQQDLSAIGIRLKPVTLDFPSLIEKITKTYSYEACLLGMVISNPDPDEFMNVLLSSAATHQWNPSQKNPATPWEAEIDKLVMEQASQPDSTKRKRLWLRVQEILGEQKPFIYLVHPNALAAVGANVQGVEPVVLRPQLLWNAEHISIQPRRQ